ncbi:autotransporter outer membrane beta-barrel domain-containing protein [Myxococcota bacterium]|nr:autotransporter outer membrane beta-barrel domain-containing protein [Myxococcota bacterium]
MNDQKNDGDRRPRVELDRAVRLEQPDVRRGLVHALGARIAPCRRLRHVALVLALGVPGVALAQGDASTGASGASGSGSGGLSEPAPSTSFQLALRLGAGIPFGKASGLENDELSKGTSAHGVALIDVGYKLTANIFIGGYFGLGRGGMGSDPMLTSTCEADGISCASDSLRVGLEAQYHFTPASRMSWWAGYGVGLERLALAFSGPGGDASTSLLGVEYALLSGGFDYRVSETFGIGPVVSLSLGSYVNHSQELNGASMGRDIDDSALHAWLNLGVRLVLFP